MYGWLHIVGNTGKSSRINS